MKFVLTIFLTLFCCAAGYAQVDSIEKEFERNRLKYKLEKFSEGEDATSGFDYLYYSNKTGFVKMRMAWTSAGTKEQDTYDYYFKDGKLILMVRYPRSKAFYKGTVQGKYLTIAPDEKLYFTGGKLSKWIEKGREVPAGDSRWQAKEKEILDEAKDRLEYYKELKENQ